MDEAAERLRISKQEQRGQLDEKACCASRAQVDPPAVGIDRPTLLRVARLYVHKPSSALPAALQAEVPTSLIVGDGSRLPAGTTRTV